MKKVVPIVLVLIVLAVIVKALSGGSDLNTVPDKHFTASGELVKEPVTAKLDSQVVLSFFVESSGSMNGFFRNGVPTGFKRDVYQIMSYYSSSTRDINIMTNNGGIAGQMSLPNFQTAMNVGALESNASTQIPIMLTSIINKIKKSGSDVGVLVSDMKYSPVGSATPEVLLSQYGAEVAKIAGESNLAFSLVGAVSDYVDKTGNVVTKASPYYYLIIGKQDKVSFVRNGISSMLEQNHTFVDNLDFGYKYASVPYTFGNPKNAVQYDHQPTFYGYGDDLGYCEIPLELHLESYRWLMADKDVLKKCFTCKSIYGSKVQVESIDVQANNFVNKELKRSVTATIRLKVSNMPLDMEVIEWNVNIPDAGVSYISQFTENVQSENDVTKSYSLGNFIVGISQGGIVNRQPQPNYILITKQNP